MNTTIINDCWDQNATGRQVSRANALLSGPTTFVGVKNHFEAAGNLIDSLDAFNGTPGVILMNIAPRNGDAKKMVKWYTVWVLCLPESNGDFIDRRVYPFVGEKIRSY